MMMRSLLKLLCGITVCLAAATLLAKPNSPAKPVPADPSRGTGGATGTLPTEKIDVAGRSRDYRLVVPKSLDSKTPAPLVFAFHGYGDTKESMASYTGLDKLAEQHKFILAYPEGRLDGQNHYWSVSQSAARHDLEFFDNLLERLTAGYNIDRNRVYLVGMSNGAFFVHLVASQRAAQVAAIASHSGGIGPLGQKQPLLKKKYAVMIIHGDQDQTVKLRTGQHARDVYKEWEHTVEYLEIPGLDHEWGTKAGVNEKIWKFFEAHPLQRS